jgi:hypothetical protein
MEAEIEQKLNPAFAGELGLILHENQQFYYPSKEDNTLGFCLEKIQEYDDLRLAWYSR